MVKASGTRQLRIRFYSLEKPVGTEGKQTLLFLRQIISPAMRGDPRKHH